MTHSFRDAVLAIVAAVNLAAGSWADDAQPDPVETPASQAAAAETASPQAADEGASRGSAASEAPADETEGSEGEPGAGADGTSQQNEPTENRATNAEEEPSAEDEAFLQDPFGYLQSDMQSATMDLKEGQTNPPAEVTQPRILRRLGLLIEQLERRGSGAGQAGQRVNRPAEQSSLMRGPGGQNEMRAARDDGRDWADLSPRERQRILQSKTDGFPAGYDDILADYFRRVARAQQEDVSSSGVDESSSPAAAAGETTN
jgi:hypothetical protein